MFYVILCTFLLIFLRFRGSQGVLGVLGSPRRALGRLGSSPGRFWDLLGRPGGVPGRRPIITFRKQIRYKSWGFGAWAIFTDVKGRLDFVCFFIVLRSVVFVNWGGEFVVKPTKSEGFEIGPLRKCQEKYDEQVGFGRWIMGSQHQYNHKRSIGILMIFIFANVWFVVWYFQFVWFSWKAEYWILAGT